MIKRFGTPPKAGNLYRIRPGAYAVLVRDDRVLLTFQEQPKPEFQLPGGGIDAGEHALPALRREVMEETGWIIGAPLRLGAFREFTFMPEYDVWAEKICNIYFARPIRALCPPIESGHHCHWVPLEDAIHYVPNLGSQHFLKQAFRSYC